jgi:glycerophosphoryl diester phosphodiesterase
MTLAASQAGPRIAVHGHRGARAAMPENTLPAFRYALELGVDVLELDMAVTKDNVVVVSHDPEMNPKFCRGPEGAERVIRKMTWAELKKWDCGAVANPDYPKQKAVPGTRVPTLAEVFELAEKKKVEFNIETKIFEARPELTPSPDEFVRLVASVVKKYGLEKRVMLQSFDFRTLRAAAKMAPKMRRSALIPRVARDYVEAARAAEASIISPEYQTVTPEKVAAAHKAGLQVVPWTANTAADWDRLIAAQVDAIISDDPAGLIAHLKARGLR